MGSDEKHCRVCGGVLDCHDYGGGSVWSCEVHGVRDWRFGDQGASWGPRLPSARAPVPGTPAPAQAGPERPAPAAARRDPQRPGTAP